MTDSKKKGDEAPKSKSEDYLRADAVRKQAAKALSGFSLKSKTKKQEAAIELYEDAAAKFKYDLAWEEAADCYEKILGILSDMKVSDEIVLKTRAITKECAEAYATDENAEHAREKFYALALLLKEADKFYMAGAAYQECAEMEVELGLPQKALDSWVEAADAYNTDGNLNKANNCYLKVAEMKVEAEDYEAAVEMYEKVAQSLSATATSRMTARIYLYMAALLRFALAASENKDVKQVQSKVNDWCENFHGFKNEHQQLLLSATLEAFLGNDLNKFISHLAKYDKQYKLTPLETKLFLKIKKKMAGEDKSKLNVGDDVEALLS
eukprot:gb/GEZN01011031.1/.p1 GENE.gb/GEZN01011031.1/~~gb/GEZN01011031.1/.p1  ORF type:complete len:324 (-),score=73.52 gb/GEZN01011031.1/:117-1088(-)